jgi:hypothetical protein
VTDIGGGDTIIASDCPEELGFAIGKASQRAKASGRITWVYSRTGFFWMTENFPPDDVECVGRCYPGGRNMLYRKEPAL